MLEFKMSGLVLLLNIFSGIAEDVAPNFYCNKKAKTWDDAMEACLNVRGTNVAFDTGIGKNIENINLKSEADVWTADYAWPATPSNHKLLCGFNFLSKDDLLPEIMYGDCDVERYYFCKNGTNGNRLDVYKSERDAVKCTESVSYSEMFINAHHIVTGYYWKTEIRNVSIGVMNGMPIPSPNLCGTYSADIGTYFVDCAKNKLSLCNIPEYKSEAQNNFDKNCFVNDKVESTMKQALHAIPTTARDFRSTEQSTAAPSYMSFTSLSSPSENVMTITTRQSLTVNRQTAINDRRAKKQEENDQNLGVSVGVPVGLGVVVLCGMIFGLYIMRRNNCWKSRSGPYGSKEGVSQENVPSPKPENASFNKSYELSFIRFLKGNKTYDKHKQKDDHPPQNPFPESTVVRKKNPKILTQGENKNSAAKENTYEHLQEFVCEENISYCYARAKHNKGVDLFVNSTANQNSKYSFAVEMAEDPPNTGEEDYDVTFNVTHFNTQNNTYNTLQLEEYGSFHNQRSGDNTYNILNIPNYQDPENDYDTANQRDHNVGTNSLYNHLC